MTQETSKDKSSAAELLLRTLNEIKDRVETLSGLFEARVPKQSESPASKINEAVESMQPVIRSLKESGDYISLNLSGVTFRDIKSSIEMLNKTVKDMTFVISGLDTKLKAVSDLLSSIVRNTRELSEDIKSNTALMNMLMRALETKSAERETQLLKNMQTSTELIEKFTTLVKTQLENKSKEE